MPDLGFIYWVRAEIVGHIKIGFSRTPATRLEQLRLMSPVQLTLVGLTIGSKETELSLHRDLSAYRLHGEWFLETKAVLKTVVGLPQDAEQTALWMDTQIGVHPHLFQDAQQAVHLLQVLQTAKQTNRQRA